jgi:hypothetical protein
MHDEEVPMADILDRWEYVTTTLEVRIETGLHGPGILLIAAGAAVGG